MATIQLNPNNIPKHIAFIIDGNGRWATARGKNRSYGHKMGVKTLESAIKSARRLGVKIVSVYAFSTENWKRPKEEVDYLFALFASSAKKIIKQNNFDNGVCYRHMGDATKLPQHLQDLMKEIVQKSAHNTDFVVNLGINYGGHDELMRAVNKMLAEKLTSVTIADIQNHLDTAGLPNPELIIRTGGEERVSNFMLFQMAYSEFYFTKTYWPDFDEEELVKALAEFQNRKRKYGGLLEDKK